MTSTDAQACASAALMRLNEDSQRCANPYCDVVVEIKSPRGKHVRYCSTQCRMDGYVLRRVRAIINRVGLVRFYDRLDQA